MSVVFQFRFPVSWLSWTFPGAGVVNEASSGTKTAMNVVPLPISPTDTRKGATTTEAVGTETFSLVVLELASRTPTRRRPAPGMGLNVPTELS